MNTSFQFIEYVSSQFGALQICADDKGVTAIRFVTDMHTDSQPNEFTQEAGVQLMEYFAGDRQNFDLTTNVAGTDFQQQVWQQLLTIPCGKTTSYADIAKKINNPKAVRAVGTANGRNPLTIVVPCHRVIGADGSLTGYAWGTSLKEQLLNHEKRMTKG